MSDQPKTELSTWERSTTRRFLRWLFSRRVIRRILIVLAWTVTILGLFYGEENWRGRHAWNQYREAAAARGLSLDWSAYIPKPVPDDQNFAATPFFKTFFQNDGSVVLTNDLWFRACDHISETNNTKYKGHRHFTDLAAWQKAAAALQSGELKRQQEFETDITDLAARAAAAPAVLEGMNPDAAVFAELRAASSREYSRFPVVYDLDNPWVTLLPHLAKIKQTVQRLNLEACAELAAGQTDQALADVKLGLSLADSIKSEPILISYLVRVASVHIAIQPVWEGLAEHRWTDAQLQELQARFSSYDLLADMEQSLKEERAVGTLTADLITKKGLVYVEGIGSFDNYRNYQEPFRKVFFYVIGRVMPSGWYDREKLNYNKVFDAQFEGVVDLTAKTVSPQKAALDADEVGRQIYGKYGPSDAGIPHKFFELDRQANGESSGSAALHAILHHLVMARLLLPALRNVPAKAAAVQTAANQAALACALERYRLSNGQFPETLEALTPRFISRAPNDVITGQPYKYRRTDDGKFILYSVGWNEKDDGGVPGTTLFDQTQGDWVWSYPAK
ncbi:MAG: hypothetical protein ABSG78_09720 [Verrucomicrobiota bacterium]|jgi:hypothetical protein